MADEKNFVVSFLITGYCANASCSFIHSSQCICLLNKVPASCHPIPSDSHHKVSSSSSIFIFRTHIYIVQIAQSFVIIINQSIAIITSADLISSHVPFHSRARVGLSGQIRLPCLALPCIRLLSFLSFLAKPGCIREWYSLARSPAFQISEIIHSPHHHTRHLHYSTPIPHLPSCQTLPPSLIRPLNSSLLFSACRSLLNLIFSLKPTNSTCL